MRVRSSCKPVIADQVSYELDALEIEPLQLEGSNVVIFLLVISFNIENNQVEGDHLYWHLNELLEDAESYFGVPDSAWVLEEGISEDYLKVEEMLRVVALKKARELGLSEEIRFLREGEEIDT